VNARMDRSMHVISPGRGSSGATRTVRHFSVVEGTDFHCQRLSVPSSALSGTFVTWRTMISSHLSAIFSISFRLPRTDATSGSKVEFTMKMRKRALIPHLHAEGISKTGAVSDAMPAGYQPKRARQKLGGLKCLRGNKTVAKF